MPMSMMTEVWGSTLLTAGDTLHRGGGQQGNKSLLSFRSDIGVPGYTGFISSPYQVQLPIKCGERTGKPTSDAHKEMQTTGTVPGRLKMSEYGDAYRKSPADTRPFGRTGGGYWITQHQPTASAPFIHTSTYQSEMLNGAERTENQLVRTLGLPSTLSRYEAARQTAPRAQSADPTIRRTSFLGPNVAGSPGAGTRSATQRPNTAVTTTGEMVGYQTTTENALSGAAWMAAKSAASKAPLNTPDEDPRYLVMPRAMPPGMHGSASAYIKDFGEDASDPMERAAPSEKFQTRMATGRDLQAGTTNNTNNPPGYTGHVAASQYNRLAQAQSAAPDERINRQWDACLFGMDQYNRERVPGYTGYKPKAPRNITLVQPSQGPPTSTTTGAANLQATKHGVPSIDNTHYINSRAGLMTFFTSKGEFVSDNGLTNAQEYYRLCPPGNHFHGSRLPTVTDYGKKFLKRNSLV